MIQRGRLKRFLIYIVLLSSMQAFGQVLTGEDTVFIGEVVISRKKAVNGLLGFKRSSVDSVTLNEYSLSSVADLLSENSTIFIKSYGTGGSATPSFRGTGAGNTRITWNGIKIENPMLGQPDLSLLPSGMTDEIHILHGGGSMEHGSGAAGGSISLESGPFWDQPASVSFMPSAGSFGRYSGMLNARTGSRNFNSVTKGFYLAAENNFPYMNTVYGPEPFIDTRQNNQVRQYGIMEEVYYRRSENILSARLWYQKASRNLPSSLLTLQNANKESQDDESLRIMLDYDVSLGNSSWFATGAWLMNRLDYLNSNASIDSRNFSGTWVIKTGVKGIDFGNTGLDLIVSEELNTVNSNNYNSQESRNSADITLIARRLTTGILGGSLLVREILYGSRLLIPDFSAGIILKPLAEKEYYLKGNVSRSSRIPTLNDLYWSPGGNTGLRNEYAFMWELDLELNEKLAQSWDMYFNATLFRNSIRDMIQWRPGEFSWWSASNIGHVYTRGLETSASIKYNLNRFSSVLRTAYSFTRAYEADRDDASAKGYQLIYVPEHQFNASLRVNYGRLHTAWRTFSNGIRYTANDNSKYLPAFLVNSLTFGIRHNMERGLLQADFDIENLFNEEYQTIAYYPLPGRACSIRLMFQFKAIQK